jgi:hypothetical protein
VDVEVFAVTAVEISEVVVEVFEVKNVFCI